MPALSSTTNATSNATSSATSNALQVLCAWPVSGQYGPGTRYLYYALITACVFARKAEWLRNACLAAALLFPAVAALHGIVLAVEHADGAVDMDVYGAFQLCSIGILAAPVTVRLSRTYFYDPGRNAIFLWTGLILAGLLSLTVEFFRISTSACPYDDSGNPLSSNPNDFPYKTPPKCGLTCSIGDGPFSPLRQGSQNNIFVVPAPDKLTFNTATLLAAGCCVPAVLSLVFMWNKILEINWKTRFGNKEERIDEPIEGTNGATIEKMRNVNALIGLFLSALEIPVFGAAVLAILIMGERNFWSDQVYYQTEPISCIGQWAPIVGTGLAVFGSLYLLLAEDLRAAEEETNSNASIHHCNCSMHEDGTGASPFVITSRAGDTIQRGSIGGGRPSSELAPVATRPTLAHSHQSKTSSLGDAGYRRKVAKALVATVDYISTASHDRFNDSEFKHGKANDFPEIPGEEHRNRALPQIREQYNRPPSRANSFRGSVVSVLHVEGSSAMTQSPFPSPPTSPRQHASTFPADERPNIPSTLSASSAGGGPRMRRDTLEVPSHSHTWHNSAGSSIASVVAPPVDNSSPAIVVSSDTDLASSSPPPLHSEQLPPAAPSPQS